MTPWWMTRSSQRGLTYFDSFWDFHMRYVDAMKKAGWYLGGRR